MNDIPWVCTGGMSAWQIKMAEDPRPSKERGGEYFRFNPFLAESECFYKKLLFLLVQVSFNVTGSMEHCGIKSIQGDTMKGPQECGVLLAPTHSHVLC